MANVDREKLDQSVAWSRRPDKEELEARYAILRCPPNGFGGYVCISHDVEGCYTHWFRGRTMPCRNSDHCEACQAGEQRRWHGWVFLRHLQSGETRIFEFTGKASQFFDRYFKEHRTLRGAIVEAWRDPKKDNGRLFVRCKKWPGDQNELPSAPQLRPILARLWDLPDVWLPDPEISRKVREDAARPGPDFGDGPHVSNRVEEFERERVARKAAREANGNGHSDSAQKNA